MITSRERTTETVAINEIYCVRLETSREDRRNSVAGGADPLACKLKESFNYLC